MTPNSNVIIAYAAEQTNGEDVCQYMAKCCKEYIWLTCANTNNLNKDELASKYYEWIVKIPYNKELFDAFETRYNSSVNVYTDKLYEKHNKKQEDDLFNAFNQIIKQFTQTAM